MSTTRGLVVLLALGLAGCIGSSAVPPPPPPPPPLAAEERAASIELDRAEAAEVLSAAQQLLGERVLVEATALASLRCVRVTVKTPDHQPRSAAAETLFDALRAKGLRVWKTGGAWNVSVDDARPPACAPAPLATAGDYDARLRGAIASIREISPTEHVLPRKALDTVLENEAALLRSARMLAERENGAVVGFRVLGVRSDSLLERLGFQNGDRVERVLGKPFTTPEQAVEAYAELRNATRVDIDVVRRDVPLRLVVRIEP